MKTKARLVIPLSGVSIDPTTVSTCKSFFPLNEGAGQTISDVVAGVSITNPNDSWTDYDPPMPRVTWGGMWTYDVPSVFVPIPNSVTILAGVSGQEFDLYVPTVPEGTYSVGTKKFLSVIAGRIITGNPVSAHWGYHSTAIPAATYAGILTGISASGTHTCIASDGSTVVQASIGAHVSGTDYTVWSYGSATGTFDASELVGTGSTINSMTQQSLAAIATIVPSIYARIIGNLYGAALFVFDGDFPSNYLTEAKWMGGEWARGNKVLSPRCVDWT